MRAPAVSLTLAASRRRLWGEIAAIAVSIAGAGFVYGLTARDAGFGPLEAMAMSTLVFAGAAQFAAVGYLSAGMQWPAVLLLTAIVNSRHLLYSAALAPWLRDRPAGRRAIMAHVLTDEAFALSLHHFQRVGRADEVGYWRAALVSTFIPWNLATAAGALIGGSVADPAQLGLDLVFPSAMAALAVGLVAGRRELVAALVGAAVGVLVSLIAGTAGGILAGGLAGPLAGMLFPPSVAVRVSPDGAA